MIPHLPTDVLAPITDVGFLQRSPERLVWLGQPTRRKTEGSRSVFHVRFGGKAYALKVQIIDPSGGWCDQNAIEYGIWKTRIEGTKLERFFVPSLAHGHVPLDQVRYSPFGVPSAAKVRDVRLSYNLQAWSNLPHLWESKRWNKNGTYDRICKQAMALAELVGVASDMCSAQFFVRSNGQPYIHDYGFADGQES